uniref:Cytosine-specific methyltransferase n=2 Tax=Neisseria leonii TaxID=2995413 RepID=A0A9X4EAA0_9NEIS|nr:DNA (cytosine-5-)-methyltransferase [Neisseria sp. 51.81]MDD9328313.1 DNA (cytosine-5-)-methyltransferase [Neisseria sp. 51.81]
MKKKIYPENDQQSENQLKEKMAHNFQMALQPVFTFIDLFAGIGGFRIAMQNLGGKCVFTSEWDDKAKRTYEANFGEVPFGDITLEETKNRIPENFDVLCAGFPCQPFSIAGVSKKKSLGRETGFLDKTQGTLFFDVADIIRQHRPKAFLLENVKNLVSHDKGNTFRIIKETLELLDYLVFYRVMNAKYYVPQNRERIFIVGFDKRQFDGDIDFDFPTPPDCQPQLHQILESEVDDSFTLSDKLWLYLQNYAEKHRAKGNGFGFGLADLKGISRTLSARYYKDGSEVLIPQLGKNPRKLTPRECARLMGYPENFIIDAVSKTAAYKQFGNSVAVPLVEAIGENIVGQLVK